MSTATTATPPLVRWMAAQIIRQHTETAPLAEWRDPQTGKRVLAPYRATGRCSCCTDDGCQMYTWASTVASP